MTFWGMLGQVFRGGSLRAAVREIQASVCAADGERDLSNSTGSYTAMRAGACRSTVWMRCIGGSVRR